MKIGIDFISSTNIVNGIASYTGGTNYAKAILKNIIVSPKRENAEWILYLPTGYKASDEDADIFENDIYEKRYATTIEKCYFKDIDKLFLPQVNGQLLITIPKLKKKNSHINIYGTLHDRQHNYYRFDWLDRFYYSGIKRTGIPDFFEYYIKRILFNLLYNRSIKCIDKVFTVSNYSMQKLMHKNIKNIKYFVQESLIECNENRLNCCGDYILFVGGGRPEKNLLRTMFAFQKYKEKSKKEFKLIVTGVSDSTKKKLISAMGEKYICIKDYITFMSYLPYDELEELYSNCRYVTFTSKGEGYGLPVREAFAHGKMVLASRTTSVPEVAGAALCYVDPFDIESIANGFEMLDSDTVLSKYESYAKRRNELINQIAKQDMSILIDELLE